MSAQSTLDTMANAFHGCDDRGHRSQMLIDSCFRPSGSAFRRWEADLWPGRGKRLPARSSPGCPAFLFLLLMVLVSSAAGGESSLNAGVQGGGSISTPILLLETLPGYPQELSRPPSDPHGHLIHLSVMPPALPSPAGSKSVTGWRSMTPGFWPRGLITGVHPLNDRWAVLESIWNDSGSGSFGDHNLYLIDLRRFQLVAGVHQGGTHSLNAEMFWFPGNQILFLRGDRATHGWGGELFFFGSDGEVQGNFSLWQALNRVSPRLARARWPGFLRSRIEMIASGVVLTFPEMDEEVRGEPDQMILPWKTLMGEGFAFRPEEPVRRYPLTRSSSDGKWILRDHFNGEGFQPSWELFGRDGQAREPGLAEVSDIWFDRGRCWVFRDGQIGCSRSPPDGLEKWQFWPLKDICGFEPLGKGSYLVARPAQILLCSSVGRVEKIMVSAPFSRSVHRRARFTGAWLVGESLLIGEQTKEYSNGEVSRLWLVPGGGKNLR